MPDLSDLPDDRMLDMYDIASLLGLSTASVRTYHTDAIRRRRDDATLPQDMPAPDQRVGRSPAWKASTIREWQAARADAAQRNLDRLRQPRGSRVTT